MHEHKKGMNAQCPANADCSPSAAALAVKHLLDRLLAAISLLFFSPLFLIIYIAIKIEGATTYVGHPRFNLAYS